MKETFAAAATRNLIKPSLLTPGEFIAYRATYDNASHFMWRPSIFMPRWASRIFRDIESIRVERLQEISEEDAIAEGAIQWWLESARDRLHDSKAKTAYRQLWESINGPGSWDTNPYVWVITFKRN